MTEVGKLTAATTSASEQAKAREVAASKLIDNIDKTAKALYTSGREEMVKVRAEASKAVQQAADEGVKAVQPPRAPGPSSLPAPRRRATALRS